ncbi:hypothetical protein NDU88_011255 [Pleurodeles waltl]|uniref:Uncharacterized protein n=1 Tax=Pleurodeles waltl TaxID=8319 RepID=A0AAV7R2I5_PLEWA|nr:hypothetical protein NDU88_011255 [Pleurodeles waltl]
MRTGAQAPSVAAAPCARCQGDGPRGLIPALCVRVPGRRCHPPRFRANRLEQLLGAGKLKARGRGGLVPVECGPPLRGRKKGTLRLSPIKSDYSTIRQRL